MDGQRLVDGIGDGCEDIDGRNEEGVLLGSPEGRLGMGSPQISTSSSGFGLTS